MDRNQIENFIDILKDFENRLTDDSTKDSNFLSELDGVISTITSELQSEYNKKNLSSSSINVKVKKLDPNAVIPTYAKNGDAGMDLVITSIISENTLDISYGFGISMEIPEGFVGLVFPRSSIRKYDLVLSNAVGVIDSGYRGELKATFKKTGLHKYEVGDRGAQIIILPYPQIQFLEVDELSKTERGDGGFGSTGK